MDVRTLGIDLAKNLFQVHGVDGQAGQYWSASSDAGNCCRSWRSCDLAWWQWRRVAAPTIGPARLPRSDVGQRIPLDDRRHERLFRDRHST